MSNYPPPAFNVNPYQPPLGGGPSWRPQKPFPTFVMVVLIIDSCFMALRALMVVFGAIGVSMAGDDPMVARTGIPEVATGLLMVLLGVPANIAMLMRQGWGAYLAYAKVAATLASIGVGLWQMSFMIGEFQPGTPEFVGAAIGGVFAVGVRLGLIALYVSAVLKFTQWMNESARTA